MECEWEMDDLGDGVGGATEPAPCRWMGKLAAIATGTLDVECGARDMPGCFVPVVVV